MPSLKTAFSNMRAAMPWYKKIWYFLRNNSIKVWRRQSCCGHAGQPGCLESAGSQLGNSDDHTHH